MVSRLTVQWATCTQVPLYCTQEAGGCWGKKPCADIRPGWSGAQWAVARRIRSIGGPASRVVHCRVVSIGLHNKDLGQFTLCPPHHSSPMLQFPFPVPADSNEAHSLAGRLSWASNPGFGSVGAVGRWSPISWQWKLITTGWQRGRPGSILHTRLDTV